MKTLPLILFFFFFSLYISAQSITSCGISVASNSVKNQGKQMYYIVGQLQYLGGGSVAKKTSTTVSNPSNSLATTYQVKSYPNPAQDRVFIQFSKAISPSFRLYDILGNEISQLQLTCISETLFQIQIQNLSSGQYILQINSSSESSRTIKIIKQN